jgi:integrase
MSEGTKSTKSKKQSLKFTKTAVEALQPTDHRQLIYDETVPGLAVRISPSGHKSFYYFYRLPDKGRSKASQGKHLGPFPAVTVEQARLKARQEAAKVVSGRDPAKELQEAKAAKTVREALQLFQTEHVSKLKSGTIISYTAMITNHLIPKLGMLRVKDVTYSDVARLHHEMKATPYLANRTYGVISVFFNWCEKTGYRPRNTNPSLGITKYREHKRLDFMGETELAAIGVALDRMEKAWHERQAAGQPLPAGQPTAINPQSAAIIKLLIFTGARKTEILSLKWNYLDLEKGLAHLPDSKTGYKVLQLPAPALEVLKSLPQIDEFVFPSTSACGYQVNIKDPWKEVMAQAKLTGWRIHDLRHAFASMMVNSGASLPFVGKILGHSQASTTARYAHVAENPARKAAEEAAAKIAASWKKPPSNNGIIPFRPRQAGGE